MVFTSSLKRVILLILLVYWKLYGCESKSYPPSVQPKNLHTNLTMYKTFADDNEMDNNNNTDFNNKFDNNTTLFGNRSIIDKSNELTYYNVGVLMASHLGKCFSKFFFLHIVY
jgi:hypothetical protein